MRDLAEQYATDYLGKVFYFCLKKTGDPQEAEKLDYYAAMEICNLRMMTVHDEVEAGRLRISDKPEKSILAI